MLETMNQYNKKLQLNTLINNTINTQVLAKCHKDFHLELTHNRQLLCKWLRR